MSLVEVNNCATPDVCVCETSASTALIFINDLFRGEGIKYQNFP